MKRSRARSPDAIKFARNQRATANEFASSVWQWVRHRQICRQKFRREVPLPPYTADFCCVELKLILEVDGAEHRTPAGHERDRARDDFLHRQGYQVVRISGYEILRDPSEVLQRIEEEVKQRMAEMDAAPRKPLTPDPSPRSGARGAEEPAAPTHHRPES